MTLKPLSQITPSDIEQLVSDNEQETNVLDFKRCEYNLKTEDAKVEMLKDLSAFANSEGGMIYLGVSEKDGRAEQITGCNYESRESYSQTIVNLAERHITPRIRPATQEVVCGDKKVLIIRVEPSGNGPHQVTLKSNKFHMRVNAQTTEMNRDSLRSAFLRTELLTQRIRDFRNERIAEIESHHSPIGIKHNTPKMVLHIIPEQAWDGIALRSRDDVREVFREAIIHPLQHAEIRNNLEGVLWNHKYLSVYAQVYRSGIVELAKGDVSKRFNGEHLSSNYICQSDITNFMLFACNAVNGLHQLRLTGNAWMFLTLLDVTAKSIGSSDTYSDFVCDSRFGFDRKIMKFSEVEMPIQEYVEIKDFASIVMPLLDDIWQSCGYERSPFYDNKGNFTKFWS